MAKRRKRRKWSYDQKRIICAQTGVPGVSVAQFARRHDLNANQVFNWLKDPKFAPDDHPEEDEAKFLPVEVIPQLTLSEFVPEPTGYFKLELSNGHRLRISNSYDPKAIARLVRQLT